MNTDAAQPKPRRRWYQFSLRTMLIGVALLSLLCARFAHEAMTVHERRAWLEANPQRSLGIRDAAPSYRFAEGNWSRRPSIVRLWLGDEARDAVFVEYSAPLDKKKVATTLFPEADVFQVR